MGDLRNKYAKELLNEQTRLAQARRRAKGPLFKPKCASCGRLGPFLNQPDGSLGLFYCIAVARNGPPVYCCEECLGPRAVGMTAAIGAARTLGEVGGTIVSITCQGCRVIRVTRANLITRRHPWAGKLPLGEPVDGFACRRCWHRGPVIISSRHYIGPQLHGAFWETQDHRAPQTCACEKASYDSTGLAMIVNAELTEWAIYCPCCLPAADREALVRHQTGGAG